MSTQLHGRRFVTLLLGALAALLLVACDAELGIATRASRSDGGGPMLMPSTDAGLATSDAFWQAPDAYVPPSCAPQCAGRQCGPDGCGGTCGACATGTTCNAAYQCQPSAPTGGTHAVTLYGTSSCGYCVRARRFFRDNGVAFTDRDLSSPAVLDEALQRVHALTGEYRVATPTIIIDDEVMLGWSEARCRTLLGL